MKHIRKLYPLLDLLFPRHCVSCNSSGYLLCPDCQSAIQPITPPFCMYCGLPISPSISCQHCRSVPTIRTHLTGLRTAGLYQTPLDTCIWHLKYKQQRALAEPLGRLLAQAFRRYQLQVDLVMPVPLHKERQQQRGYNQSQLLAKVCAQELALPLETNGLTRIRATPAQITLVAKQRYQNVQGAFHYESTSATPTVFNRRILIIDDVSTTGSTLAACANPLWRAGAREVWGLVLARPWKQALKRTS